MPATIGKFDIQELLGEGATSSVYRGTDPFTGQEVAIKVAKQAVFSDPVNGAKFKKMFMNEASLAGKLRHPHIVRVLDAGVEDDLHYIVMEYVPGHTLKDHTTAGRLLPFEAIVEIAFKCCNALEYAHRQGVIHRDIKPANLLLVEGTDVKVSDFGTALMVNSDHTQIFGAVGSPAYMSPEQVTGDRDLTFQTDIYSLGVVMYQMLSGQLPFFAKTQVELFRKIADSEPTPLTSRRPDVPEPLVKIVEKSTQKRPADRYNTFGEMARDLALAYKKLKLPPETQYASDTERFNLVKGLSFFVDFTDREVWEVLRISKWHNFSAGTKLIEEGRVGTSLYILATGSASIIKNDAFLGVIDAGQCFGEMAYVMGKEKRRTANVVANSEVTVIKIRAESIAQSSDQLQTSLAKVLLRILADRLEKTSILASIV
jgi:eukaryotic-like serine/threonine-protein kinase